MLLKSILIVSLHCACGLRLPEAAHSYAPSSIGEQEAAQSGINSDLVAPAASSRSQYYQQPNYHPTLPFFEARLHLAEQAIQRAQQQGHTSPFLYNGPLIMIHPGDMHTISHHLILQPKEQSDTESGSHDHVQNTYVLYRPDPAENPQFVDMLPPTEEQDEPNYYGIKPSKKTKKYSAVDEKKKHTKGKNLKEQIVDDEAEEEQQDYDSTEEQAENEEGKEHVKSEEESSVEESAPASRLDFQMHGHRGPKTYKFGYDTGKGKNRQFKVEEKDENGDVFGQYGFYDDKGKLKVVKYASMKDDGFKVL